MNVQLLSVWDISTHMCDALQDFLRSSSALVEKDNRKSYEVVLRSDAREVLVDHLSEVPRPASLFLSWEKKGSLAWDCDQARLNHFASAFRDSYRTIDLLVFIAISASRCVERLANDNNYIAQRIVAAMWSAVFRRGAPDVKLRTTINANQRLQIEIDPDPSMENFTAPQSWLQNTSAFADNPWADASAGDRDNTNAVTSHWDVSLLAVVAIFGLDELFDTHTQRFSVVKRALREAAGVTAQFTSILANASNIHVRAIREVSIKFIHANTQLGIACSSRSFSSLFAANTALSLPFSLWSTACRHSWRLARVLRSSSGTVSAKLTVERVLFRIAATMCNTKRLAEHTPQTSPKRKRKPSEEEEDEVMEVEEIHPRAPVLPWTVQWIAQRGEESGLNDHAQQVIKYIRDAKSRMNKTFEETCEAVMRDPRCCHALVHVVAFSMLQSAVSGRSNKKAKVQSLIFLQRFQKEYTLVFYLAIARTHYTTQKIEKSPQNNFSPVVVVDKEFKTEAVKQKWLSEKQEAAAAQGVKCVSQIPVDTAPLTTHTMKAEFPKYELRRVVQKCPMIETRYPPSHISVVGLNCTRWYDLEDYSNLQKSAVHMCSEVATRIIVGHVWFSRTRTPIKNWNGDNLATVAAAAGASYQQLRQLANVQIEMIEQGVRLTKESASLLVLSLAAKDEKGFGYFDGSSDKSPCTPLDLASAALRIRRSIVVIGKRAQIQGGATVDVFTGGGNGEVDSFARDPLYLYRNCEKLEETQEIEDEDMDEDLSRVTIEAVRSMHMGELASLAPQSTVGLSDPVTQEKRRTVLARVYTTIFCSDTISDEVDIMQALFTLLWHVASHASLAKSALDPSTDRLLAPVGYSRGFLSRVVKEAMAPLQTGDVGSERVLALSLAASVTPRKERRLDRLVSTAIGWIRYRTPGDTDMPDLARVLDSVERVYGSSYRPPVRTLVEMDKVFGDWFIRLLVVS